MNKQYGPYMVRYSNTGDELLASPIVRAFKRSDGSVWIKRLDGNGDDLSEIRRDIRASTVKGDGRTQMVTVDHRGEVRVVDNHLVHRLYPHAKRPGWWKRLIASMFAAQEIQLESY